jgi:hypothetical protein
MRRILLIAAATATIACGDDVTSVANTDHVEVRAGKSTGGMVVSSTTPDSATQDTTLDVVINGSGFVAGTTATWALAGTEDQSQVRTNSTQYVSSRKLIANITISASATVAKWDVLLKAGGKGGIGTEAFAIKPKGNVDTHPRVNYVIDDEVQINGVMHPAGIRGDGRLRDGAPATTGFSEYQGEFCGVAAFIDNQLRENGNLQFDPDNGSTQPCGAARSYRFNLNGFVITTGPLARVFGIWSLGVGQSMSTGQGFGVMLPDCAVLAFNSEYGGDDFKVTRIDSGAGPHRWIVESQGSHLAACVIQAKKGALTYKATGVKYFLPFRITMTEVPYPYSSYP